MGRLSRRLKAAFCCLRADSQAYLETASDPPKPTSYVSSEKSSSTQLTDDAAATGLTPFQQQARQIAQIPVAGIRRTTAPGGGAAAASSFVTTYQTIQNPGGRPRTTKTTTTTIVSGSHYSSQQQPSSVLSTDTTMVGTVGNRHSYDSKKQAAVVSAGPANSTWQGKPKGTPYDRREELTEEDEDAWARLAM